jgi:uncharacterized protein YbaR (Trm112 family)
MSRALVAKVCVSAFTLHCPKCDERLYVVDGDVEVYEWNQCVFPEAETLTCEACKLELKVPRKHMVTLMRRYV